MAAPLGGAAPLEELVVETGAGEALVEAPLEELGEASLEELVGAPLASITGAIWEGKPTMSEESNRCLALCAVILMAALIFSLAGIMESIAGRPLWRP